MRPENIHKSVATKEEEAAAAAVVPSFFKCPISLEFMRIWWCCAQDKATSGASSSHG
jgi:hypothetical protein